MSNYLPLPEDLTDYTHVYIERSEDGYVTWRRGTGGNVELLHIEVREKRVGHGRRLLTRMLRKLQADPPCGGRGTVFGFTRMSNVDALGWYDGMGFDLSQVCGVYAEGVAVCFSAPYALLVELHLGDDE